MCAITVAIAAGLAFLFTRVDLVPDPASAERALIDRFIKILLVIAAIVFAIVVTVLGYALIFFRRQPGDETDARPQLGKLPLELTWTIVPFIIVILLSFYGARVLDDMTAINPGNNTAESVFSLGAFVPGEVKDFDDTDPRDLAINVDASRYVWVFSYPDFGIDSVYEMEVPVNRRIVLNLSSKDVIHSFWVQQWGPKQDAVPGLSPVLRFTPTVPGQYTVQCSQLCGFGHTNMTAPVRVVSDSEFVQWVEKETAPSRTATPPPGTHVMIDLEAQHTAFDKTTITVPAGVEVMIEFSNEDKGVPHNFALYKTSAATEKIFSGPMIVGPNKTTYTFTAPTAPGTYFFRCDAHPDAMTGTFIVK